MKERAITIVVVLAAILFGLVSAWPHTHLNDDHGDRDAGAAGVAFSVEKISLVHEYRQGVHFYVGTLDLPTPCHNLFSEALVRETYPEQVTLRIQTSVSSPDCTASTTPRTFKTAFQASKEARVGATINSVPVDLEVREISLGEHLSL
ncbi:MAG: hypothetical protein AAB597_00030 [Patescibacteria group bacterium]